MLNYKKKIFCKNMKKILFKNNNINDKNYTYQTNNIIVKNKHYTWHRYPGIYIPKKYNKNNTSLFYNINDNNNVENNNNIIFIILVFLFYFINRVTL